jgi:CRP-like cAMP-binding protein
MPQDWPSVSGEFREVHLVRQQVLVDAGEAMSRLYFPLDCVVSTVAVFENGSVAEMAVTGREGMVGISALFGSRIAIGRHIVQVAGHALELGYDSFVRLSQEVSSFREALLAFLYAFQGQALQFTACNSVHSVEQRAARWLLMCHDRTDGDSFSITQEFLAEMLGVSRLSVSNVARALQRAGLIRYNRGNVFIEDRAGLERVACECYRIVNSRFQNTHEHVHLARSVFALAEK